MMNQKSKPKFVLISDVHFSLNTLELADIAFRAAIDKASELGVPLVDAGDLTNDKAILRGEVVNRLIKTMRHALNLGVEVYCLVGNHSLLNERGTDHALNFLKPYCTVIDTPSSYFGVNFIPYQNNAENFIAEVKKGDPSQLVVGHQGTKGGVMGDYIQDRTAFDPLLVQEYRIFLGHYHQNYELLNTVSIGNPYTLTFGEANDGPKGFIVVNEDGSFTREILNLRKHVILQYMYSPFTNKFQRVGFDIDPPNKADLPWVKVQGLKSQLDMLTKEEVSTWIGHSNFKLDKIPTESEALAGVTKPRTDGQVLDDLIDSLKESPTRKEHLKDLWRKLLS